MSLLPAAENLKPHYDINNDTRTRYAYTTVYSKGVTIKNKYYRFAAIGYSRKSIGNYLNKIVNKVYKDALPKIKHTQI